MKKTIAGLLCAAMILTLGGCARAGENASPETAAPTAGAFTPTPAAAEETAAPSPEGRVTVRIGHEQAEYREDGADTVIFRFSADRPQVTVEGREDVSAAVNAALEKDYLEFVNGGEGEGLSGKEGFLAAAREDYALHAADGLPGYFTPFYLERAVSVTRADDRVICLTFSDGAYTGGAHGYTGLWSECFDARTGEKLRLEDLSDDPAGFRERCADRIREDSRGGEHTALAMGGYFPDYEQSLPGLLREGNWYLNEEGIVVVANPYEIAPYASGLIEFTLPYDWLRGQIREEYLPAAAREPGALSGEIVETAPASDFLVDDGTNGQGACVLFTAEGPVEDVRLSRVSYAEYGSGFWETGTLWLASRLDDGQTLLLRTWFGDVFPTLKLSWKLEGGEREAYLLFQSGKDGSLVMMEDDPVSGFPAEVSGRLPMDVDLDGDGRNERLELTNTPRNGGTHWQLTVDGRTAGDAYALDAELISLWLADLDGDGVTEILFSGDMGSDDYVTCAWRGDTLEPILFTGETRREHDPSERTASADGRAVVSYGTLYLESWSYQLGTYAAVRAYEYTNGAIGPAHDTLDGFDGWSYLKNSVWLTAVKPVPALWPDGGEAPLPVGTEILLQGTDGNRAFFVTRDGRTGAIRLEFQRDEDGYFAGWTVGGEPEDEFFQMLPYAG